MKNFIFFLKYEGVFFRKNYFSFLLLCVFYSFCGFIFAYGLQYQPSVLQQIGGFLLWIFAVFSLLLSLENILKPFFQTDYLEQIYIICTSYIPFILAKWCGLVFFYIGGLVVISPLFTMLYHIAWKDYLYIISMLLLTLPSIALWLLFLFSLTRTLSYASHIILILFFPFLVPFFIFGSNFLIIDKNILLILPSIKFLIGFFLFSFLLLPYATSMVLKYSLRD